MAGIATMNMGSEGGAMGTTRKNSMITCTAATPTRATQGKPCIRNMLSRMASDEYCTCYCCELNELSEGEMEYYSSYEYRFSFEDTPEFAFKACRDAFELVSTTIKKHKIAKKNPDWLERFNTCIFMAQDNDYYPELDFGTQTVCWVGMMLAGGRLDCLENHIEEWRVQPFGRDMLKDILACTSKHSA